MRYYRKLWWGEGGGGGQNQRSRSMFYFFTLVGQGSNSYDHPLKIFSIFKLLFVGYISVLGTHHQSL